MEKTNNPVANVIATINKQTISVINQDGLELIPIKPICEALGIDAKAQRDKIQEHPILCSTGVLSTSVALDGKQREQFCLPVKFIFGWLFTIHPDNVSPEARESLIQYQQQTYNVIYEFYSERSTFVTEKYRQLALQAEVVMTLKGDLKEAKDRYNAINNLDFDTWRSDRAQMEIPFSE